MKKPREAIQSCATKTKRESTATRHRGVPISIGLCRRSVPSLIPQISQIAARMCRLPWELLSPYNEYLHIKDAAEDGTVVPAGEGIC